MEINNTQICNVCLKSSANDNKAVFVKATKGGESIDVCTSCIPHIIHGSGDVVKSNEEVKKELNL
jgi:hypothetical protein